MVSPSVVPVPSVVPSDVTAPEDVAAVAPVDPGGSVSVPAVGTSPVVGASSVVDEEACEPAGMYWDGAKHPPSRSIEAIVILDIARFYPATGLRVRLERDSSWAVFPRPPGSFAPPCTLPRSLKPSHAHASSTARSLRAYPGSLLHRSSNQQPLRARTSAVGARVHGPSESRGAAPR